MSKKAYIFSTAGANYRIIVKADGQRVQDLTFNNPSDALAWLEQEGITDRVVCDTRDFSPDTI